jgi:hypothetical protein
MKQGIASIYVQELAFWTQALLWRHFFLSLCPSDNRDQITLTHLAWDDDLPLANIFDKTV